MSLFVFSSVSFGASSRSSRSSGVTRGKFPTLPAVLPPPRLAEEELDVELRPESTTGDACHSRRKSGASEGIISSHTVTKYCFSTCFHWFPHEKTDAGLINVCQVFSTYVIAGTQCGSWT